MQAHRKHTNSQNLENSTAKMDNQMFSEGESVNSVLRTTNNWDISSGQGLNVDNTFSQGETTQFEQSLDKLNQITQDFSESSGFTKEQSAQLMAYASVGIPLGQILEKFGVSAGVKGSAGVSANLQKAYQEAERITDSENFREAMSQVERASQDESVRSSDDHSKRIAESLNAAFDEQKTLREEISQSLQEVQTARDVETYVKNNRQNIDTNLQEMFTQWLPEQSLPGSTRPMGYTAAQHITVNEPFTFNAYQQQFIEQELPNIAKEMKSGAQIKEDFNKGSQVLQNKVEIKNDFEHNKSNVMKTANEAGVDLSAPKSDVQDKVLQQFDETQDRMSQGQEELADKGDPLQEKVGKKVRPYSTKINQAKNLFK